MRIDHRVGMQDVLDAFIKGNAGANREHQQRDDEAPEIQFAAVAERMAGVWRLFRLPHAVQQQTLIAGIDHRVDGFAEHRR